MENQFDLGFNIASIETELPDPVITLTGADALTASETAEAPLLSLKVYGRSCLNAEPTAEAPADISSIGDSGNLTITVYGKNLFPWNNYNDAPFTALRASMTVENSELIIATNSSTETKGAYISRIYMGDVLSNFNGKFITISAEIMTDMPDLSYSFGMDYKYQKVSLTDSWNRYSYSIDVDVNKSCNLHFFMQSGTADTPTIKVRNIQIELGTELSEYEPHQSAEAAIATELPLRGIPVSNSGNYTDESGQEWVCDTLDHAYGEPAQVTRRIHTAEVIEHYDLKGGGAIFIDSSFDQWYYAERGELYITSWGEELVKLYGAFLREQRTASGELTEVLEEWEPPREVTSNYYSGHKLIGKWTVYKDVEILPAYELTNGEAVPDDFISTTGRLSQGAEIIYPANSEPVLLTTAETEALNSLSSYSGSTSVYNENTAEMTVKLLREDYEMQYIHWIKESQSFVCEKSGKYKIICVGGGSSGGLGSIGAVDTLQAAGTTTSFGTIISADGGGKTRVSADLNFDIKSTTGGQSGYDGINYGSTAHVMCASKSISSAGAESTVMWGTGHGYGAGGGAKGISGNYNKGSTGESITFVAAAGKCGKVESTIVDLEENQSVFCTIGGGGVLKVSESDVLNYIKNAVDPAALSVTIDADAFSACASDGADGVIVIQYLGI